MDTSRAGIGRRTVLKVLGSAGPAAAVAACSPVAPEKIIPFVVPPEDVIPGVATWYATVCGECPAGCGARVRTREGRAVKVEGNPEHPVNRGALCVRGQASLQGLYNPDRLRGPLLRRTANAATGQGAGGTGRLGGSRFEPVAWDMAQQTLIDRLTALRENGRADRIAIVTPLMTGTLDALVDRWAGAVGGARRLRYEPFAYEALRAANRLTFGRDTIPYHDLAAADLVVSFGADFLETWLSTVGTHARSRGTTPGAYRPAVALRADRASPVTDRIPGRRLDRDRAWRRGPDRRIDGPHHRCRATRARRRSGHRGPRSHRGPR